MSVFWSCAARCVAVLALGGIACSSPKPTSGEPVGQAPAPAPTTPAEPASAPVPKETWVVKDAETAKAKFADCEVVRAGVTPQIIQEASPTAPVWAVGLVLPDQVLLDRCYVDALSEKFHCSGGTCP